MAGLRGVIGVMQTAWRVFRAMVTIAGRPVMLRALATFAAVGLPAGIIFSPQGMSAKDLLRAMRSTPAVGVVVWVGWLALSAVATNAVWSASGLSVVRAMRPSRRALLPSLLAMTALGQLPWAVLWGRGAGAFAPGAVLLAIAAAASLFTLTRRPSVRAALTGFGAITIGVVTGPVMFLGVLLAPLALLEAWRVAPETRSETRIWTRWSSASPLVAIATVHWLRLVRAERLRLVLASMVGSLGAAGLLTLRSDPTPRPGGRAVAIMTVPLVVASSLLIAPLLACEEGMRARFRVLRVRHAVVVAAFLLAVAAPTTAFAATAGLALGAPAAPLTGTSLALSAIVVMWGRRHARMKKPHPTAFAVGIALIALITVTLAMELL